MADCSGPDNFDVPNRLDQIDYSSIKVSQPKGIETSDIMY